MYGPTETTIYSIIKHVTDANDITIGWPVANTQVYILDEEKEQPAQWRDRRDLYWRC
jgi:non-ribosomal peptide synthetase component F